MADPRRRPEGRVRGVGSRNVHWKTGRADARPYTLLRAASNPDSSTDTGIVATAVRRVTVQADR